MKSATRNAHDEKSKRQRAFSEKPFFFSLCVSVSVVWLGVLLFLFLGKLDFTSLLSFFPPRHIHQTHAVLVAITDLDNAFPSREKQSNVTPFDTTATHSIDGEQQSRERTALSTSVSTTSVRTPTPVMLIRPLSQTRQSMLAKIFPLEFVLAHSRWAHWIRLGGRSPFLVKLALSA